ncbi:hypothetical protein BDV97DRAFT_363477, partial [Delphinella strobiligena]
MARQNLNAVTPCDETRQVVDLSMSARDFESCRPRIPEDAYYAEEIPGFNKQDLRNLKFKGTSAWRSETEFELFYAIMCLHIHAHMVVLQTAFRDNDQFAIEISDFVLLDYDNVYIVLPLLNRSLEASILVRNNAALYRLATMIWDILPYLDEDVDGPKATIERAQSYADGLVDGL